MFLFHGDALEQLKKIPDESVHCCVTSPPYWGLRVYGGRHPEPGQIGQEDSVQRWVDALSDVFREVRRVLRSDGTCWVVVGDSYENKSLVLQPNRLSIRLRDDGWFIRNEVIWYKSNPVPSSVRDRMTASHDHIIFMSKTPDYFFNMNGIMDPSDDIGGYGIDRRQPHDVWKIGTKMTPGFHAAPFPVRLIRRIIMASCGEVGACPACGRPWENDRKQISSWRDFTVRNPYRFYSTVSKHGIDLSRSGGNILSVYEYGGHRPTCDCDCPRDSVQPCMVLDPFWGSGTSGLAAARLGHDSIGIDLVEDYLDASVARLTEECAGVRIYWPKRLEKEGHLLFPVGVKRSCPTVIVSSGKNRRFPPAGTFLKWVGNKTWLVNDLMDWMPPRKMWGVYCEPFLGSGAFALSLLSMINPPPMMVLGDINPNLMSLWMCLEGKVNLLMARLHQLSEEWYNAEDRKAHYYEVRDGEPVDEVDMAARFWYVIRCGFDGVWRSDGNGKCTTCYVERKKPGIARFPEAMMYHNLLRGSLMICGDYRHTCLDALSLNGSRCFFYMDPPYPRIRNTYLTGYLDDGFGMDDYVEMARFCNVLKEEGHFVMVSTVRDDRMLGLYPGWEVDEVIAPSKLPGDPDSRGYTKEFVFRSWGS